MHIYAHALGLKVRVRSVWKGRPIKGDPPAYGTPFPGSHKVPLNCRQSRTVRGTMSSRRHAMSTCMQLPVRKLGLAGPERPPGKEALDINSS